jgi:A/G-specific adenine glycosylase
MKNIKYSALIEAGRLEYFRQGLLTWFWVAGRTLPWRETRDPYAILVSEILLHQTTVATVRPVYETFLSRFPNVAALDGAPLEAVKAITDPLGYKVRGQWLKDIARAVVADFGGEVPCSLESLMSLPGVGRYTAGAVLSFAFGVPAGVLDTNVARIMSRFFAIADEPGADRLHRLWSLAEAIVPESEPWGFNQGLMDFGALICTARKPQCLTCPVAERCPSRSSDGRAGEGVDGVGVVFWERPRPARRQKATEAGVGAG